MDNQSRIAKLKEREYQELFGVKKEIFEKMLQILEEQFKIDHKKGGHPLKKLSLLDKLIITLGYYREYRSMQHIAFDYGVSKSTICDSIQWVENTIIKSGNFDLPPKKKIFQDTSIKAVIVDATECEIERPKKKNFYTTLERKKDSQ